MTTNIIKSQLSLRYDTYANWIEKNPVLRAGEAAVVVIPANTGVVTKEPAVLFKIGNGASTFSQLDFTTSLAADVYDWAKSESKPDYSVDEITGLSEYVTSAINAALYVDSETEVG